MLKRSGSGFTIVELLIVIVVIAILAAITIVSYNGIASRAKNTEVLSRIDAYTKVLQLYKAQNGSYPLIISSETGSVSLACLGSPEEYPASGPFNSGSCYNYVSPSPTPPINISTSSTIISQLKTVTSSPLPGSMPITTGAPSPGYSLSLRGILYISNGSTAYLQYLIPGNQDCGRGSKSQPPEYAGNTLCAITLS